MPALIPSRDLSRSLTPIATADEPEAQTTRGDLQERLTRKFRDIVENAGTQTLIDVDGAISEDPAYTTQPQEHSAEARFLSPVVVGVGGGFHLDHPTHRPGNNRTYRRPRGGPPTTSTPGPDHTELNPRSPTESTELEGDLHNRQRLAAPFSTSQEHAPLRPALPILNPRSLFLGYPEDQGSHRSDSPIPPDNPPISHSLVNQSLDGPPTCEHIARPSLRAERSLTHISTSSKSLGDPIPILPLASNREGITRSASQHSPRPGLSQLDRGSTPESLALRLTPSEPEGHVQLKTPARPRAKRPLETPETPLPARKRPSTAICSTAGGKVYNGRLNMVEINSERVLSTSVTSRQVLRHRSASSRTRQRAKSTTGAGSRAASTSQQTGNDDFNLLDDRDDDQFVVDSALKGVLVKPGYRKPNAQDLPGWERAIWKDVRNVTWAFSMGQGNFQTRGVFASWVGACFSEVVKQKLPNLDTAATIMSDNMLTVILNNLCNARYQDLLRLRKPVQDFFKLKNPSTPEERQDTEDKIREIYPDYYHYGDLDNYVDPYEGDILRVGLESIFFYGPKALGAMYPNLFRRSKDPKDERKHLAVLAYVATMIQFCLGEWTKGYYIKDDLDATIQHGVWLCHFDGLKNVSLIARKRLIDTYNIWIQNAYNASQAQTKFKKRSYIQTVVRQKDVRPDTPSRSPSPNNNNNN
ncbi:unnamed protein product [Rhizoctonia solani]|uniref:DUF6532 domain-containing protein n=1 Tax=Rhizoctonia solani TaxID=456999 RepID=A0A8H3DQT9_9AGAM|nr:unnamed protein product [Rhizoctonia solani]